MPIDIQVAPAAENVLADESLGVSVPNRPLHDDGKISILAANVDVPALRTYGQRANHDALDHRVRIVLKDQPAFASAVLSLVPVAQDVLWLGRLLRHERPLHAGRKSRPAPPAQPGILDFTNNGVRFHGERLLYGLIAVQFEIAVNVGRTLAEAPGDDLYLVGMGDQVSHINAEVRSKSAECKPTWFYFCILTSAF